MLATVSQLAVNVVEHTSSTSGSVTLLLPLEKKFCEKCAHREQFRNIALADRGEGGALASPGF